MTGMRQATVTIAKDGTTGTANILTNGLKIYAIAVVVPTLEGSTTSTTKIKSLDSVFSSLYLWSPAGLAAKAAGTYFTYSAEESAAPKPLDGVPTWFDSTGVSQVQVEIVASGAQATQARVFTVMLLLED